MRTFGVRAVRKLGHELVSRMSQNRIVHVKQRLRFRLDSYSKLILANRKQIEMALLFQAKEVERSFTKKVPIPPKIYFAEDFNEGVDLPPDTTLSTSYFRVRPDSSIDFLKISYSEQVFKTAPGIKKENILQDAARLATLTSIYKDLSERLQGLAFWHLTSLDKGLQSSYPGHNGIPMRLDPRDQPWYTTAVDDKLVWLDPYIDPASRQIVVAAALAVRPVGQKTRGVTALVIPINKLLARSQLPTQNIFPETQFFMSYPVSNPETGKWGIQIYVREEYSDIKHRFWRSQIGAEWLVSSDETQFQAMIDDLEKGKGGHRRMPYKGRDSLWVYDKTSGDAFLIMITPYKEILKGPRRAEEFVQSLIGNLLAFTRIGLSVIVLLVVLGAFLFSRTITKPIQALVESANNLSKGRFDSRVDIRSRDEFGDMGKVFNSVGPRLKELYKMRESLALAREVQQNLLPGQDPQVSGMDVAGTSIYCDETGGDYYDFLGCADSQSGKISAVVGDVSDHGIPSALLMTTARALLRQRSAMPGSIKNIISDVNFLLTEDVETSGRFMTLFYAKFDTQKKYIRWVRAGHDPAILYDPPTDSFYNLAGQGLPLGIFSNSRYEESKRQIDSGQIVVMGTDGIWETTNSSSEMFGKMRLRTIIRQHAASSAKDILNAVIVAVDQFRSRSEQEDDVTLVVVKIK
jgi:sigma-B regulation protein RsbU (phosphoserine phosphatase)